MIVILNPQYELEDVHVLFCIPAKEQLQVYIGAI